MAENGMVKMHVKGMKELQAAFAKSPQIVKESLDPAIKKAILEIQAKSITHMPTDRGFLRNSNITTFTTLKGKLENKAPYAMYVHEGTKPHFPPISALEGWSNRHGIAPFLVARAISRKGTKAIPFYEKGIDSAKNTIDKLFKDALGVITDKLSK